MGAVFLMAWLLISVGVGLKNFLVLKLGGTLAYPGAVATVAVMLFALAVYCYNSRKQLLAHFNELMAITSVLVVSVLLNSYLSLISVYFMPVALTAFVVAPLTGRRDAFVLNVISNVITAAVLLIEAVKLPMESVSDAVVPVIAMLTAGIGSGAVVAYLVAGDTRRLIYIGKGLVTGIVTACLVTALAAVRSDDAGWVMTYTLICAIAQVLVAQLLQPVFEGVFNLITNSRLLELTDRSAPLMRRLSDEAPGTFNHAMAVANFAEQCAAAIGENPYLARACAYYHDVGKLVNPDYFRENQSDYNPHDEILPEVSAEIIREHTDEGYKLCMKYRIPKEIADVTVQHHGTLLIPMFYEKARRLTDGTVDPADYSYKGITPRTKIAAIIMICDSGEAAIRAMDKPDGPRVDALVKSLIASRVDAGQFDYCDISLKDLTVIRQTIVAAYGGVFHRRIKYPNGE